MMILNWLWVGMQLTQSSYNLLCVYLSRLVVICLTFHLFSLLHVIHSESFTLVMRSTVVLPYLR